MISPQDFVEWVSRGGVLFQLSVQAALLPFISLCQGVIIPYAPLDQVWTCDEILLLLSTSLLSPFGHELHTAKDNVYEK